MANTQTTLLENTIIIEERGLVVTVENLRKIGFKMSVKALVDISINDGFRVQDIRVVEGADGLYIVMPEVTINRYLLDRLVMERIFDLILSVYRENQ